jgi:hypothetical protein
VKNPIPDASTARRWNLLSEASSSSAIKSLARISVTASPAAYSARLVPRGRVPSAAAKNIRLRQRAADLKMNDK